MKIIGQELAVIREHLGLSVGDIQHRTKLSKDVIESIENGVIFDRKNEKDVYLRTYIRSFARALKIDDSVIVKALDQLKYGNYDHLLLDYYPELNTSAVEKKRNSDSQKGKSSGSLASDSSAASSGDTSSDAGAENATSTEIGVSSEAGAGSGASASTQSTKMNNSQRSTMLPGDEAGKEINWAKLGKQFNQPHKQLSWKKMFGWIVFVVALLASVYLFFTLL